MEVILSGGGAHNHLLIEMIQGYLPESVAVGTQDDIGGSNDAKEAVAFAILGNETLHSRVNNAPVHHSKIGDDFRL